MVIRNRGHLFPTILPMSAFRRLADATRSFFRADGNHATDVASLRLLQHSGTRLETLTQVGGHRRNAWGVIAEIRNEQHFVFKNAHCLSIICLKQILDFLSHSLA